MERWTCPPQWPQADRDAHERSMRLLDSVIGSNGGIVEEVNADGLPSLFIESAASGRWYKLDTYAVVETYHDEGCGFYGEPRFEFNVVGGLDRLSVHHETDASAILCLHPGHEHHRLPVGDQVAALTLALVNDRATALRIPLLAQFLACDKAMLSEIFQFSVEGIIRYDEVYDSLMIDDSDINEQEPADFYALDPGQLATMNRWGGNMDEREGLTLDDWFERVDRTMLVTGRPTWHHDQDKVWDVEERLLNK